MTALKPADCSDDQLVTAIRNALAGKGTIEGVETIFAEIRRRHRDNNPAVDTTSAYTARKDTWDPRFAAPKKGARK